MLALSLFKNYEKSSDLCFFSLFFTEILSSSICLYYATAVNRVPLFANEELYLADTFGYYRNINLFLKSFNFIPPGIVCNL